MSERIKVEIMPELVDALQAAIENRGPR